jgi:hypothetical protein
MILKVECVPLPICLPKAQQSSKGHKADLVVNTLCHPMNVICVGVKEEGGMKLCNDFSIPVILKTHQINPSSEIFPLSQELLPPQACQSSQNAASQPTAFS